MNDDQVKEITDKLDIIVKIMAIQFANGDPSPKEQIKKLSSVGMSPSQIGKLLGKSTNIVTAYMARIKKKSK